jgi:uncharacterized membrane protein HdeD (DUF308 family)
MSYIDAIGNPTTPLVANKQTAGDSRTMQVFLVRGLIAILWAIAFGVVSDSLTTEVTAGAAILLVLYPAIDSVGSLVDARTQHGSARRLLLGNAAFSAVAAVSLGVAATGSVADVFAVFGVWAVISGAAQLVVALWRRAQLGWQWPMLLAGGVSVIGGVVFIASAARDNPRPSMLAVYAATGGIDFVIQAWLLARRRRRLAEPAGPILARAV